MKKVGGTWSVGTKDNTVVYLTRDDAAGNLVFEAHLTPGEARKVGAALISQADVVGGKP